MEDIQLCEQCNVNRINYYTRDFMFRGKRICFDCFKKEREILITPYYQNHIPTYVDGGVYNIFEFTDGEELLEYLVDRYSIGDDTIIVKSKDNFYLMTQNITKKHWWVLGGVANFDLKELNILTCNYDIYNDDKTVNGEKLLKWFNSNK